MRLVRTAAGGFVNVEKIERLVDERSEADQWVAQVDLLVEPRPQRLALGRRSRLRPHLPPRRKSQEIYSWHHATAQTGQPASGENVKGSKRLRIVQDGLNSPP